MITATWRLLSPINRKQFNPLNFSYTREFASAQDFTILKSKQNIEKDSIPPKPKKPPTVFVLYYNSVRNKLQKEYPHCKITELSKIASEKWAQIDPTIKQNFQKQFHEQFSIYKQKLMDYENSLTNEQKMEIKSLKKGHTLKQNEIKQKLMELGKPKRPLSAFMLFMQSKKNTKNPNESYKDWLNNITNEWKNLTMVNKSKYNVEASDLFKKYKIELQKWKEEMIQAGHYNIVKSNVKHKLETDKHEK
ncbi:PREDICTED: transcription factor A, mitochondrial [Acromyrmex echinatior]|nr:PREDICTED: transcription factor A, mitochondrial [Acromyrmex echinatior]